MLVGEAEDELVVFDCLPFEYFKPFDSLSVDELFGELNRVNGGIVCSAE